MRNIRSTKGLTLVELLLVVAIVGILALFGYPGYTEYIKKTARKQAVGKVLEIAGRVEQFKTQKLAYPSTAAELNGFNDATAKYGFAVATVVVDSEVVGYTVTATPVTGTNQVGDRCGTLVYSSTGIWTFANSLTESDCL